MFSEQFESLIGYFWSQLDDDIRKIDKTCVINSFLLFISIDHYGLYTSQSRSSSYGIYGTINTN